jgi:hypothetical protein
MRKFICDHASESCKAAGCPDATGRTWRDRGATWKERMWMAKEGVWRCDKMSVSTKLVPCTDTEEIHHDV